MSSKHGWGIVIGSAASLALSSPLAGQHSKDTTRLDPVVVTAERLPTSRTSTPATVTVLTSDELQARGIRSVSEALRDVAGLEIVRLGSYGGQTSMFMRGGESDYVKVLVDGVPINDPGGAIDLADLTTDNLERVEIVRGPVSVLYGSDAVSGVVQIFTKRGGGDTHGDVNIRAGSYTAIEALGGVGGGTDVVNYSVTASRASTNGVYAQNNEYRNIVWSGLLRATPNDATQVKVALRYTEGQYHYPTDGSGQVVDANAFHRRNRIAAALEFGRYFTNAIQGQVLLALNQLDGGIDDRSDGPADTLGYFGYSSVQAVLRRSADVRVNGYAALSTAITAGLQLEEQRERSASESLSEFGPSSSSFDRQRLNWGYYVQMRSTPTSRLDVTLGARLDDNEAFGTFVSYRGGAVFRIASGTRIRTSVGKAFKEPTFFENFAETPFARGNPELAPERSFSWEVGVEQGVLRDRVVLGATYFDQQFRDLIQYTVAPPNPDDPNYFNIAMADARGVEFEIVAALDFGLQLRAAYTYLETEVRDGGFDDGPGGSFVAGQRLLRRPTHAVSLVASQGLGERATVTGSVRYVGDRDDRNFTVFPTERVILPSYVTVDLAGELTVWRGASGRPELDLTARVVNLLDEDYREVYGFLTPGRVLLAGVRMGL
ncbi:MAG: TonB-dependent receptor [Gemmatimonadales bacterium]|jgi:vitamin B12 transporter